MMTWLVLRAIRVYQVAISPYKGFRCAYAFHTGRCSCSALGYRAIRRFGVWHGLQVLEGRLHKCGVAYRRYHPPARFAGLRSQAGECDCGGCDMPGNACDIAECFGDIGDCGRKKRGNRIDDSTFVPPRRSRRDRNRPDAN